MSPAQRSGTRRGTARSLHRALIAAEAILVIGVAKDWIWRQVLASSIANWGKVVLAMITAVGILGGFYLVLQRILTHGMSKSHQVAASLPLLWPTVLLHAVLLGVLFVLYARMLGVTVF